MVSDPHLFNEDSDPDPAFHFHADPDSAAHDANLRPLAKRSSRTTLRASTPTFLAPTALQGSIISLKSS